MSEHDLSCNAHDVPWGTGMCSCKGRLKRDLAAANEENLRLRVGAIRDPDGVWWTPNGVGGGGGRAPTFKGWARLGAPPRLPLAIVTERAWKDAQDRVYEAIRILHNMIVKRYESESKGLPPALAEKYPEYAASWAAWSAVFDAARHARRAINVSEQSTEPTDP